MDSIPVGVSPWFLWRFCAMVSMSDARLLLKCLLSGAPSIGAFAIRAIDVDTSRVDIDSLRLQLDLARILALTMALSIL